MRTQRTFSAPSGACFSLSFTSPAQSQSLYAGLVRCERVLILWDYSPSYRYDAHPMAILTSAFSYLGSYYSEANPSLQGMYSCMPSRCVYPCVTSVHARSKALHEWRQILTRQHGQADLQDHWESHDTRCVRTASYLLYPLLHISCIHRVPVY